MILFLKYGEKNDWRLGIGLELFLEFKHKRKIILHVHKKSENSATVSSM